MYINPDQAQKDFRKLLDFLYEKDWRAGQDIEQLGAPIITGDFVLVNNANNTMGDVVYPGFDPGTSSSTIPGLPTGPLIPYTSDSPSFFSILGDISGALQSGIHTYAMTATDLARAQMQVAAMQAQARAGFIAQPQYIGGAQPPLNPMLIIGAIALVGVVMLMKN